MNEAKHRILKNLIRDTLIDMKSDIGKMITQIDKRELNIEKIEVLSNAISDDSKSLIYHIKDFADNIKGAK